MIDLKDYLEEKRRIIDSALDRYLPSIKEYPLSIHEAMRYSVFAGGKRLRPILTISAAELLNRNMAIVLPTACAIELIHTYSLIHDDLPSLDNDDYRRGKLTCHRVYGEAIAILAGDALLTLAFDLIAKNSEVEGVEVKAIPRVLHEIALSAGTLGLIGGQVLDIQSEGKEVNLSTLQFIHSHKTAALIRASLKVGALLAGASEPEEQALSSYGERIGLAFQIVDDILDVQGDKKMLGKETRKDAKRGKVTYPSILGLKESEREALRLAEGAKEALQIFGERGRVLRDLADFVVQRSL